MKQIVSEVGKIQNKSSELLSQIKQYIPAGSSSTMRVIDYHKPLIVEYAQGAYIWDADGNKLIDYNMGYGPLIFGHRSEIVNSAITKQLNTRGAVLGFATSLDIDAGKLIHEAFPSIEMLRFSSSGTEVGQTAARLARAYTGRSHIVLFEGHYHGSSDSLFHRYNCTAEELNPEHCYKVLPGTNGMGGAPHNAYLLPWNDINVLSSFLAKNSQNIAALIMEPVMGNSGVIPPEDGYLTSVRNLCDEYGIVLIFDEIITGGRIARGGAQERYGVKSDLTILAKASIGGCPGSIIGGKKEIMKLVEDHTVFHGGVYSGNPLTVGVTIETQRYMRQNNDEIYKMLNMRSNHIADSLRSIFQDVQIPVQVNNVGGMISLFFLSKDQENEKIQSFRQYVHCDKIRHILYQHILQDSGVYVHPNNLEPWYLSTEHTDEIIEKSLKIMRTAAIQLKAVIE